MERTPSGQAPRIALGAQIRAGNRSEPCGTSYVSASGDAASASTFRGLPRQMAEPATLSERINSLRRTSDPLQQQRRSPGQLVSSGLHPSATPALAVAAAAGVEVYPSAAGPQSAILTVPSAAVAAPPRKTERKELADAVPHPFPLVPPFYWVQDIEALGEFEVSGSAGEVVTKMGDFEDEGCSLPISGTLRMVKGGVYHWTLQIVRQSQNRPLLQFGIQGANHARPWRLVSSARCSRSRDEGPWMSRPGGDLCLSEGDYIHCEADFRCLAVPLGTFAIAANDEPFETVFEDIPLMEGPLFPVVSMGGGGTSIRLCPS